MIDDAGILEMANDGYSVEAIAGELEADVNLVLIKLEELNRQGYDVRAPYRARSDFLRHKG